MRLAKLVLPDHLFPKEERLHFDNPDDQLNEILKLARQHPEIFIKNFDVDRGDQTADSRSPLSRAMSSWKHMPVPAFDAMVAAHPGAVTAVDSYGDTI